MARRVMYRFLGDSQELMLRPARDFVFRYSVALKMATPLAVNMPTVG
jgi:hypothetical protein